MAKFPESVEITIHPTFTVTRKNARFMLMCLEEYVNTTHDNIVANRLTDGSLSFHLESDEKEVTE